MKYEIKTITKTLLADLQTPVSIYLKMRDLFPESVLLESSDYHGNENSYSFIGLNPAARFVVNGKMIEKTFPNRKTEILEINNEVSLADEFNSFLHAFKVADTNNRTGINGLFGYTAYDAVEHFLHIEVTGNDTQMPKLPNMNYIYYKYIIVVDHFKNELTVIENIFENENSNIERILTTLENRNFASYDFAITGNEQSEISDNRFMEMVSEGIAECKKGEVSQIVLSRRFSQEFTGDDFSVYRALRSVNPSPYLFYFDFGSFRVFGSSPETHCRIKGDKVFVDPIAGTVRRTGDEAKDRELTAKLLADPKENDEHEMLVELALNDLSKKSSDVKVDFHKDVQYYSHVIHLVSRVSGKLNTNTNRISVFADTFPAGTLTGAPKTKALELIRKIEDSDRGIYGGCIGYIGLNGDLNQAITIRSFVSTGNKLYYQAGAGIVDKSTEKSELEEVNNKLGALKKAIGLAITMKNG